MASFFGHAVTGLTIGRLAGDWRPSARASRWIFWILLVTCATAADLDVAGFWLGVPYPVDWGHRGLTHSLVTAVVMARVAAVFSTRLRREGLNSAIGLKQFTAFLAAGMTHPLLDMLTNGGLGVAVLWPFDARRYFLPYRPIEVAPLGIGAFFTGHGLEVLSSEVSCIILPCACALGLHWIVRWTCGRLSRS